MLRIGQNPVEIIPVPPKAGYDTIAKEYEKSHWFKFWNENEVPLFRHHIGQILQGRKLSNAIDIGCGTGRYIGSLTEFANKVTAVDISPNMLRLARNKFGHNPSIEFFEADADEEIPEGQYDLVTINRMLSHSKSPNEVLKRVHRANLNDNYLIFITDLHPDHKYTYTSFPLGRKKIRIETYKHDPILLMANFTPAKWYWKRVYYNSLMRKLSSSRFSSIDRTSVRPIFFGLWGVVGDEINHSFGSNDLRLSFSPFK